MTDFNLAVVAVIVFMAAAVLGSMVASWFEDHKTLKRLWKSKQAVTVLVVCGLIAANLASGASIGSMAMPDDHVNGGLIGAAVMAGIMAFGAVVVFWDHVKSVLKQGWQDAVNEHHLYDDWRQ